MDQTSIPAPAGTLLKIGHTPITLLKTSLLCSLTVEGNSQIGKVEAPLR